MSYTNSKLVEYTKISPNRTVGRKNVKTVAIHCMAGHLTVETCGNVFTPASRGASSNYGIDDNGRVGMYVEEKDRSWCTSSRKCDMSAVTIEVASDIKEPYKCTDKAFDKLIDLVTDICKRNKIEKLHWSEDKKIRLAGLENGYVQVHRDYSSKSCPGNYIYSKLPLLVKEVNSRLSNKKEEVVEDKPAKTSYTHRQFIKDVQAATGAKVDGIAGPETLSKTVTVSAKTNRKHKVVLPLQKELYRLGYTEVGEADGIAGSKFKEAVMHYQNDNFGKADGIITAKKKTWKSLLGMEV